jgi:hypothetical protein
MVVELLEITRGLQKQALREDRLGQEFSAPTNERMRQALAYEGDVVKAIKRVLPSGASLLDSPGPGDRIILAGGRKILVDIKHSFGRSRYIMHLQELMDMASRLSEAENETVMILLVSNFPMPQSVKDEIELASALQWVLWGDHNDDSRTQRSHRRTCS